MVVSQLTVEWWAPWRRGDAHRCPDSLPRAAAPSSSCAVPGGMPYAGPHPAKSRRRRAPRSQRVGSPPSRNGEDTGGFGGEGRPRWGFSERYTASLFCHHGEFDPSHKRYPRSPSSLSTHLSCRTTLTERGRNVLVQCQTERKRSLSLLAIVFYSMVGSCR